MACKIMEFDRVATAAILLRADVKRLQAA